jgi:hypothetical protein
LESVTDRTVSVAAWPQVAWRDDIGGQFVARSRVLLTENGSAFTSRVASARALSPRRALGPGTAGPTPAAVLHDLGERQLGREGRLQPHGAVTSPYIGERQLGGLPRVRDHGVHRPPPNLTAPT